MTLPDSNPWSALAKGYLDRTCRRRETLPLIERVGTADGDAVWFTHAGQPGLMLKHPALVHHVLAVKEAKYGRDPHSYTSLKDTFELSGRRLLRLGVDREGRPQVDAVLTALIRKAMQRVATRVQQLADGAVDLDREVKAALFELAARALWDVDISDHADAFAHALNDFERYWISPPRADSPEWEADAERYAWSLEVRDRVIDEVIRRADLRSKLPIGQNRLRIMLLETMVNAHFALASSIVFAFALVSQHPDILKAVRQEVASVVPRSLTLDDLKSLPLTQAVVHETLRLYPSAWLLMRVATENDVLPGGLHVPRGTRVFVSPYLLHRDGRFWPDPNRFDPMRFIHGATERVRYTYIPFGLGSRMCPTASQAPRHAALMLAYLTSAIEIDKASAEMVRPAGLITLRPDALVCPVHARNHEEPPDAP